MQSAPQTRDKIQFPELAALGFVALAWIILNQFRSHLGLHAGERSGLVAEGYLGAELYLVVSGFLLSHAWATAAGEPGPEHRRLVGRWLARVYPLHLVILAAMGVLFFIARLGGQAAGGVFDLRGLVANLSLLQAWGVTPTVTWNFPAWLLSAQLAALLLFPAVARLALGRIAPPWLILGVAGLFFGAAVLVAAALGVQFTDMTAQIGALQAIPATLMGAGLYAQWRRSALPHGWGRVIAVLAGGWIVLSALLRLPDLAIWPAFPLLVYGLAEAAKSSAPSATATALARIGDAATSVYLVYLPVDIVYFHAARLLAPAPTGALAWAIWAGVFPTILAVGVAAHLLITEPAAALLGRLGQRPAVSPSGRFAARLEAAARGRSAPWRGLPA